MNVPLWSRVRSSRRIASLVTLSMCGLVGNLLLPNACRAERPKTNPAEPSTAEAPVVNWALPESHRPVKLLYVDGYPRWDFRYIRAAMIRSKDVEISCLLTSADATYRQDASAPDAANDFPGPINQFPRSMEELDRYDVVLFGDVDPRQFTDNQLELVRDFVKRKGGGFGMVAGPRWSPVKYRKTPIEDLLPVTLEPAASGRGLGHGKAEEQPDTKPVEEGFNPVLTDAGAASPIFGFLKDPEANRKLVSQDLPPLYWYSRGVAGRPGVGVVSAVHPSDKGPDGRPAPLLVVGRAGNGRTLFSAIDDSWRWRMGNGEAVCSTYWTEQVRFLGAGHREATPSPHPFPTPDNR